MGVPAFTHTSRNACCPGPNRRFRGDLLFFARSGSREGKEKVGLDVSSPGHLPKSKNSLATRQRSRFSPKQPKIASAEKFLEFHHRNCRNYSAEAIFVSFDKIEIFVLLRANSLIFVGGLATKRRAPLSPSLPFPSLLLLLLLRTKKTANRL